MWLAAATCLTICPNVRTPLNSASVGANPNLSAMLSYGYWQKGFGGDPTVIGRNIMVDSKQREIVGVMPKGFQIVDADFELICPVGFERSKLSLSGFGFQGIARLKPGATIAEANADMTRMVPIWMAGYPFLSVGFFRRLFWRPSF